MKIKKLFTIICLAAVLCGSFSGCGNNSETVSDIISENVSDTASSEISQVRSESDGIVSVSGSANDENNNSEGDFIWSGTEISGLTEEGKTKTELVIPKECTGYDVFAIGSDIWYGNEVLESVVFENDGVEFPNFMFDGVETLKSVVLPADITKIPDCCFRFCSSLEYIEIPDTVTYIDEQAFYDSGIKSVNIPEGVEEIKEKTFRGTKLEEVVLPNTVKRIEAEAFAFCNSLRKIYIPESVEEIHKEAFDIIGQNLLDTDKIQANIKAQNGETTERYFYVKEDSFADNFFYYYANQWDEFSDYTYTCLTDVKEYW